MNRPCVPACGDLRLDEKTRPREAICSVTALHTRSILGTEREPHVRRP
jgi:hypothetical protein